MIDKELIRKAAEDIDLFKDDLSAEFDRLSQPPTRTFRLWPYVAAACIALLLVVGMSVRLLTSSTPNGSGNLASGQEKTTKDTAFVHGGSLAQAPPPPEGEKDGERQLAIHLTPPSVAGGANPSYSLHFDQSQKPEVGGLEKAEEVPQEEDGYSEALLYALITEVEAKAMAEQAEEERLYRTLLEEISTNISKETTQTELTL